MHFFFSRIGKKVLYKFGRIAQLGEHRPYKPGVTGSSPVPPTSQITPDIESFGGVVQFG
jgi:hypothetical protein